MNKKCCTCKETKSMEMFSKNKSQKDGYQRMCKECMRKSNIKWYNKAQKDRVIEKTEDLEGEVWKDIHDYEGMYQISNFGNVRSIKEKGASKYKHYNMKSRIGNHGYKYLVLCDGKGKTKTKTIHRLVAIAFIENPNGFKVVNHIDGIKTNNKTSNLEWCSYTDNNIHAYSIGIKKSFEISKEELEELYYKKNMTIKHIAEIKNVSFSTLKKWFIKYGVEKKCRKH